MYRYGEYRNYKVWGGKRPSEILSAKCGRDAIVKRLRPKECVYSHMEGDVAHYVITYCRSSDGKLIQEEWRSMIAKQ